MKTLRLLFWWIVGGVVILALPLIPVFGWFTTGCIVTWAIVIIWVIKLFMGFLIRQYNNIEELKRQIDE